jgi:signal transduction histidine kinase/ligand-binding sensor domain-containing protein
VISRVNRAASPRSLSERKKPLRRLHARAAMVLTGLHVLFSYSALLLVGLHTACALEPNQHLSQYAHATWRMESGLFRSSPYVVAQTSDGYLWIGTSTGLLRFDGVRFVPWSSQYGEQLPSSEIVRLMAGRDGSLWIGTLAGLSRWKAGRLTNYSGEGVFSIFEDDGGTVWFGRGSFPKGGGSLCKVLDTRVRCFGEKDGVPPVTGADALFRDPQGNLWMGGDTALFRWKPGSNRVYSPAGLRDFAGMSGIRGLVAARDGTLWVGIDNPGPGLGLQRLVQGEWKTFVSPELDGSTLDVKALLLDREDALWVGTDKGIYRISGDRVEHFDSRDGLSGDTVWGLTEDREGNLWATTTGGLDRFSNTRVVSFSERDGLRTAEVDSVLASQDGSVWVGGSGFLGNLKSGAQSTFRAIQGLPGAQVTSLLEDHAGRLWVGVDNTLSLYSDGVFTRVNRPDGLPIGLVVGITEDSQGNIWTEVKGSSPALLRIQGMAVQEEHSASEVPAARRVAADPRGGIWLGLMDGRLGHYRDGKLATYQFARSEAAQVYQLLPDADGSVLAATTSGLVGWRSGSLLHLSAQNGLPCNVVHAMTFDAHGNLWLLMECSLVELPRAELEKWWSNSSAKVTTKIFDTFDGVRTGRSAFVAAARSTDGRLWFCNSLLLQMIDPDHLNKSTIAPPVHVEEVVADRRSYELGDSLQLPPLTRNLEIDYTALSFVVPQKVRFRYKLEGEDTTWQDAGTRRQAFYNNLRPGRYRFRVIACNNDGVWNQEGATLDFSVEHAWFQMKSFLLLCLMAAALLVWALYRLRVRHLSRILSTRFDERLAERTRIARELHDTFMQTIQGSKLVADDALDHSGDSTRMRQAMKQLSLWLGQAAQEGRTALNSLRTSATQTNDLAAALQRVTEDGLIPDSIAVAFSVAGRSEEIHPIVRDEIYRIGYEAIRNASMHSRASHLEIEIRYHCGLVLRVKDNGVGIDPIVAELGKEGHFGLSGMRERASRIRGKLWIISSTNSGTEVKLIVPNSMLLHRTNQLHGTLASITAFFRWKD